MASSADIKPRTSSKAAASNAFEAVGRADGGSNIASEALKATETKVEPKRDT